MPFEGDAVTLAELQRFFAAAATSGTGPVAGLEEVFRGSAALSASERLAIYNRAFFYRQLDALGSVFGQTRRLLGEATFERLGLSYLGRHPSEHPALERVGREFPGYLASLAARPPEPVVDLAELEWARLCALVAPDPQAVAQPNTVDRDAFPGCRLTFVPALSVLELDARVLAAFAGGELPPEPGARCAVAIWRSGHLVRHERLESVEFRALTLAQSGATLAEVCAIFDSGAPDDDAQRAFRAVSGWFARQWLQNVA